MGKGWVWVLAGAGFAFALGFGWWAQFLFTQAELVHFSVNFPASEGVATKMSCCDLGGPWTRDRDAEWNDYAAGGVLPWGEEGEIVVDLGKQGFLKRTLQPSFVSLSTHWLRNVGTEPYHVRLDMDMCDMEVEWVTFEAAWSPDTRTTTRPIEPGETYNMDWYLRVPPDLRGRGVVCEGRLDVFDAETDDLLTELPIRIVNSRAEEGPGI
jgi:hypothetical protein